MITKNILRTLCTTAVLSAIAAYADDPKKDIVGKWSEADGAETVEYKADGSMTDTLAGGDVMKGKYSFPDAAHIKVELEGPMAAMGPIVSPITIKGDTMDVTGIDGSTVSHYKRAGK
ncbi:MAG TPA: hypothetical protein VGC85_09740 [Chthoniobacterales bacterium]